MAFEALIVCSYCIVWHLRLSLYVVTVLYMTFEALIVCSYCIVWHLRLSLYVVTVLYGI